MSDRIFAEIGNSTNAQFDETFSGVSGHRSITWVDELGDPVSLAGASLEAIAGRNGVSVELTHSVVSESIGRTAVTWSPGTLTPGVWLIEATIAQAGVTSGVQWQNVVSMSPADPTPDPDPVAPENTVLPAITGTAEVGETLASSTGTWTGTPTPAYAYQWQRDGSNISGATASTYVLQAADDGTDVRCVVTATNAAGSASANSATVAVTYPAPTATGSLADVSITVGDGNVTRDAGALFTGTVGGTWAVTVNGSVNASVATIDSAGVVTVLDDTEITGATIVATYTNSGGSASRGFSATVAAAVTTVATISTTFPAETLFDSGAARGSNAADIPLTGTTDADDGAQIEARIVRADTGAEVHPWAAIATAASSAWSGSFPAATRSAHRLKAEVRVQGSAAAFGTMASDFKVGHRVEFWGQSRLARHQSYGAGEYDLSPQPTLPGTIDGKISFVTRSHEFEAQAEAQPSVAIRTNIVSSSLPEDQVAAVSAMADTLHAAAPDDFFEVVIHAVSATGWEELVADASTGRKWVNEKAVHDLAVTSGNDGGLVVFDWVYNPATLEDDFTKSFLAFAFEDAGSGGAAAFDHTLTEMYDWSKYRAVYTLDLHSAYSDETNTAWTSSIRDSTGTQVLLPRRAETIRDQMRLLHTRPLADGKMLPTMATSAPFLNGNDDTIDGDHLHPAFSAALGADGNQRYFRILALKAAEALGLVAGSLGRVEFTDAAWDYAADTVNLTARDEDGNAVPVTSLRALLSETQPSGRPAHHTDNLVGFEMGDANSFLTTNNMVNYNNRELVTPTINGTGQVVIDYSGTSIAAIPDRRKRVIFGGGVGFGVRNQRLDFTNEMWKDYPVTPFTSPDGVIVERAIAPFPRPVTLSPYDAQAAMDALVTTDLSPWELANGSGTITSSGADLILTDGGTGTQVRQADLLADVLTAEDNKASIAMTFWSESGARIIIRALTDSNGNILDMYDATGGHGSSGSPVTTLPFVFNDFNGRINFRIVVIGDPSAVTTLKDVSITLTPFDPYI